MNSYKENNESILAYHNLNCLHAHRMTVVIDEYVRVIAGHGWVIAGYARVIAGYGWVIAGYGRVIAGYGRVIAGYGRL